MAYFQKRRGSWRTSVKRKGFDRITRTFDTKVAAEAWARQVEGEMDRGGYVSQKEAENTTLSEALDRYEREISSGRPIIWQNAFWLPSRVPTWLHTGMNV